MGIGKEGHDILTASMNKRVLRILYPAFLFAIGIVLALVSAASSPSLRINPDPQAAALYQAATPTPTAQQTTSQAGSTDGIMLMGIIIVVIVLAPIVFRRSLWKK